MGVRLYATGISQVGGHLTAHEHSTQRQPPGGPNMDLEWTVPDETWSAKFPAALESCILVLTSKSF
jgi:hypothetical protein